MSHLLQPFFSEGIGHRFESRRVRQLFLMCSDRLGRLCSFVRHKILATYSKYVSLPRRFPDLDGTNGKTDAAEAL